MKNIITAMMILGLMALSVLGVVSHSAAEVIPGSFQVGNYIFPGLISFQSSINMSGNRITNVAMPTADSDAATKAYVDASGGSGNSYSATGKGDVSHCAPLFISESDVLPLLYTSFLVQKYGFPPSSKNES